ncbi:MAG: methyltransferase type 12 [Clostridiales bacterium GWF2_38_85]|nr:MAG: methyltransferase type 12 [Clostridiales bacterium GWF2_38_85]HBL84426.1 class I SAM-dependent methyltransferase [Clostridiales bacterium]
MKNLFRNTAWLYDVDKRDNLQADIPFYIDYAKMQKGEILELGCGTGRVSIALARQCFKVTGLDLSIQMLDIFRAKTENEPELKDKITIVHGDMSDFNLQKKFSMIIAPFRVFQALTEDDVIKQSLRCIREHLTYDGIFIINVFNPRPVMDEGWCYPETVQWERLDENTGNYVVKKHWGDKIDTQNQIIYPHYAYEVTDKNGIKSRHTEDLKLKYYYDNQLSQTLENAGFRIKEKFGWYDKSTIEDCKRELIFICTKI